MSRKTPPPLSDQLGAEQGASVNNLLRGTETILIVEDEPLLLELGRKALERFGYRVLTAPDGIAALEIFEAHQDEIALAILDVVMPRMGGNAVAREFKRRKPELAVLLTSGYDHPRVGSDLREAMEKYAFLRKPYRIRQLAQTIRTMLEHG